MMKLRLPFIKRVRGRRARRCDEPAAVFKTFVTVLAQMRAHIRETQTQMDPHPEKN